MPVWLTLGDGKVSSEIIYQRPASLTDLPNHYCPGCTHGVIHRLIAEVLDEMRAREKTIGVASVGCSVFSYLYLNCDFVEAPHGRAPAMATGIKRMLGGRIVFTYQGDGDLASIGMGEVVHSAARGEKITIVFVNNGTYGMTGGQMAPTTLVGAKTSSSKAGRDRDATGDPLHMPELLAVLPGAAYIARRSVHDPRSVRDAKKALRLAFEAQNLNLGFALVEILSTCPTNWGLSPREALCQVEQKILPEFPLGDFKVHPDLSKVKVFS